MKCSKFKNIQINMKKIKYLLLYIIKNQIRVNKKNLQKCICWVNEFFDSLFITKKLSFSLTYFFIYYKS